MNPKHSIPLALAALLLGCQSCVETNGGLGGDFIPDNQKLDTYVADIPLEDIWIRMADSLSGFSQTRVTIGAVRDSDFGLTTRSSAFTIMPLCDTLDFGTDPVVKSFRMALDLDTVSVASEGDANILQSVYVHELSAPINAAADYDCNGHNVSFGSEIISKGTPVINGSDSLIVEFSGDFAASLVSRLNGAVASDFDDYISRFPGICLSTDSPASNGGRINMYGLQLGYDSSTYGLTGNYATLELTSTYEGVLKDTTFYFWYGINSHYALDSLLSNSGTGSFPEYALNLCSHETRAMEVKATDRLPVEGGGGLKPMIKASTLRQMAKDAISTALTESRGDDSMADEAIIARATVVLPFDYSKEQAALLDRYPAILSPTCRIISDTTAVFAGLTDASNEDADQGEINRSLLEYSPDITYHLQQILGMSEEKIASGNYDIWMLIMANETVTTSSSSSSSGDLSEYYQYLAYQSYYNSIYGGSYSGYGSYGDSYSNYYSYMLAAMYASSSSSTTSTTATLDKDRFYKAFLCGPTSTSRRPSLKLVFAVPKE